MNKKEIIEDLMTNYNRTIKIKEDKTQEREQAVKVIASIILIILFTFISFKVVARENARDEEMLIKYENSLIK